MMKKSVLMFLLGLLAASLVILQGCRPPMLIDKDTPMYINKSIGWVEIYVYDAKSNKLVSGGWVSIKELKGKTATNYNWDEYFLRNE